METKRERRDSRNAILIAVLLCLPLAYTFSMGPAWWLFSRGHLNGKAYTAYTWPARQVLRRCKPLNDAMNWYLSLWSSNEK